MTKRYRAPITRTLITAALAVASIGAAVSANAAIAFLGVAAGDATSTSVTLWTRAVDAGAPANTLLALEITTDPAFLAGITAIPGACTTDSTKDYVCKLEVAGLAPNTTYFYRFVAPTAEKSLVGRVKTAPSAGASVPVRFAFSGDYDGLIRPYALASQVPAQNLDFYVSLGDVIYENASNLTLSGAHNGASWLNSPSVTLSGASSSLNGIPTCVGFATQPQLKSDYEKKYRENFLPVNTGGQNSLQLLYAAQGSYTTWDNHELGNRQYINGGAPPGPGVGGMPTGCGVDARNNTGGNVGNVNDVNASTDYMNRSLGFRTLRDVFLNYSPIASRPPVSAVNDPRTDGTTPLYGAQSWGRNVIYINTDSRSYRDLRIKTANGAADDTSAPRADNPGRTYLGATQLAWVKQTLLDAQNAGTKWKFVSISDPIDQIGPIGGGLTLNNLPSFGAGSSYAPVSADGGKSYIGGYRAERNDLLKFVADHHITNVVFIATDDHQNRINELTYSPTGQTSVQASYAKVPFSFSIVAGPLGATGPDLITNHTFAMAQEYANSLVAAETAAGVEPVGLVGNVAVHDLFRDGNPTANTNPQAVDFYSPDTFNFTVLDVSADGKTLTVKSVGMDATAQNAGVEYASGPQARTIFSFQVDAAPTISGVKINDGSTQRAPVKSVTVTLAGIVPAASIAPGAFTLTEAGGAAFTVSVQSVSSAGRDTLVTLGFAGAGVGADGSLPDGTFTLSVDRDKIPVDAAAAVTPIATFRIVSGNLDGIVDTTIDAKGTTWTLGSNGQISRNGVPVGQGSRIAFFGGTLYALGIDRNWWEWQDNAARWVILGQASPLPPGPIPPASPEQTMIPPASQIVDALGNRWTLSAAGQVLRNGGGTGGGGSKLLWTGGVLYTFGGDANWWAWQPSTSNWIKFGPLTPGLGTPPAASPNGALAPPLSQLVDANGAVWTIAANKQILRNGSPAGTGLGSKLLWSAGVIYTLGLDNNWWRWQTNSLSWSFVGPTQP